MKLKPLTEFMPISLSILGVIPDNGSEVALTGVTNKVPDAKLRLS